MKDQQKNKKPHVEVINGTTLTIDESLNKYKGAQRTTEKFKKAQELFSKPIIIHQ